MTSFNIDMALGYLASALLIATYVWPRLKAMAPRDAHRAIATFNSFSFFSLVFLLPGFTDRTPPQGFAAPAAYGDFATGVLAILALLTARVPLSLWPLVWAVQSAQPRRPRHGHTLHAVRTTYCVHGRTAWRRLRHSHALRAGAVLDAPRRALAAAAATCTDGGSVRSASRCQVAARPGWASEQECIRWTEYRTNGSALHRP